MSTNNKVMISLDDSILSDIDFHANRMCLSRSAFIRLLFFHYIDMSNITAGYEIEIESLQEELSRFKDLK